MDQTDERRRRPTPTDEAVDAAIIAQCSAAGPGKSVSPNDVAKVIDAEDWRRHLKQVKRRAQALTAEGRLQILRKGKPIEPDLMKGIVRLRLPV
jgi:hypothetical protein